MGVSDGGSFVVGAEVESGLAFDTSGERLATSYHTLGIKFLSFGAGAAGALRYWKADNISFGGDGHGASFSLTAAGGSGAAVWFGYDSDDVTGVSVAITAGAEANVTYVRNRLEILSYSFPIFQPTVASYYPAYELPPAPHLDGNGPYVPLPRRSARDQAIFGGVASGTQLGLEIADQRWLENRCRKPQTIVRACNKSRLKSTSITYV